MPHPEREHELQIALATALRERDEAREAARDLLNGTAAAESQRDALRGDLAAANARAEKAEHDLRNAEAVIKHGADCLAAARREAAELHNQLERLCQATESDPPFWYRLLKRVQAMSDEEWRTFISATLTGEDRG